MNGITVLLLFLFSFPTGIPGQENDVYGDEREGWLLKSEQCRPLLYKAIIRPVQVVEIVTDDSAYQGCRMHRVSGMRDYYRSPLKSKPDGLIIDFGGHTVGRMAFEIKPNLPAHAPVRLKFTFGEVPSELNKPFEDYRGTLSQAWLQEEIITIHTLPDTVELPGRYAFRYVRIEQLASAPDMDFYIKDIYCQSVTSAQDDKGRAGGELTPAFDRISEVSLKTLRNCMQTVFEDGPKRDRRIWIGDFKLQALANYYSYGNIDLVRRGLYLFAGTASRDGLVYGTVFERPWPHAQEHFPIDYCLLYNTILADYYEATGDKETIADLWPVARQQVQLIKGYISDKGLFQPSGDWWSFVDWNEQLDKRTSLQGIVIYALNSTWELAGVLERESELSWLPQMIERMKKAARSNYYDRQLGLFISGESRQVSTASQIWMILSGTASPAEGRTLIGKLTDQERLVSPVSPYLYYYVLEAMISCGMNQEARLLLEEYWGGMIRKGADTFWEVYDPEDDHLSPYGSIQMNSYCHAWSSTPVYFIRKYYDVLF